MNTPFFSIVIPSFNRPHLLERALSSVLAQDFIDFELIVINDGSQSPYDQVFEKYGSRIDKIIVHDAPKGVSEARNAGILASRGKWITFLDDDDEFNSGFLSRMYQRIQGVQDDVGFAWTSVMFQLYDADGNQSGRNYRNYQETHNSEKKLYELAITIGAGFGLTIKRACFEKAGLFDSSFHLGEDTEFVLRLLKNGYKPVICQEVGITVHTHHAARPYDGLRERVKTKVYERLAEKYIDFLKSYPEILCSISGHGAWVSYFCGDFSSGDRLLFPMIRVAPLSFSVWIYFMKTMVQRSVFRIYPAARRHVSI